SCPEGPGLSDPASNATTPCRTELPCPSCCAQTAPAVFDGCRPGCAPGDALKILVAYFSASVDWSTVTPGPMVELIEIFCRYWPLAVAGLALIRSWSSACRLSFSLSASKSALPMVQWMMPALS